MEVDMKKLTIVILLLFLVACGKENGNIDTAPDTGVGTESEITPDPSVAADAPSDANVPMDITWGINEYYYPIYNSTGSTITEGAVIDYLNNRFNVALTSKSFTIPRDEGMMVDYVYANQNGSREKVDVIEQVPDIFVTLSTLAPGPNILYQSPEVVNNLKLTRTIPRDMIERYAPHYAELLTRHQAWELNKTAEGDYIGLSTYQDDNSYLPTFSVYNLDWLEEAGIEPHGELVDLGNEIYFTNEPFYEQEFLQIINAFASEERYGMAVDYMDPLFSVASIIGMYGVSSPVIDEDGLAVPYYISEAYKNALNHISMDISPESKTTYADLYVVSRKVASMANPDVVWRSVLSENAYSHAKALRQLDRVKKVLITPPEIGADGQQGAGAVFSVHPFTPLQTWMVRRDVSDEKLARILMILDALSFDPEVYVTTVYGLEGKDYTWDGEPYASGIIIKSVQSNNRLYSLVTGITVTDVAKPIYTLNSQVLLDYAQNNWQPVEPFNFGVWGNKLNEKTQIDNYIAEQVDNTVRKYLLDIYLGKKDLAETWNDYLYELQTAGVQQYIDYYNGK
jgi:hypothetical protein